MAHSLIIVPHDMLVVVVVISPLVVVKIACTVCDIALRENKFYVIVLFEVISSHEFLTSLKLTLIKHTILNHSRITTSKHKPYPMRLRLPHRRLHPKASTLRPLYLPKIDFRYFSPLRLHPGYWLVLEGFE